MNSYVDISTQILYPQHIPGVFAHQSLKKTYSVSFFAIELFLRRHNHLRRWRCGSSSSGDSSTKKCNASDECDDDDIVVDDRRNNDEGGGEKLYNLAAEAMRNGRARKGY